MAWRTALNQNCMNVTYTYRRPFKISAEEDAADTNYIGFTDLFQDKACLVRVATKRLTENSTLGLPNVYVYLKKFKYEREHEDYMKQAQVAYTLPQFKALQENMEKIDEIIDKAFTNSSIDYDSDNYTDSAAAADSETWSPPPKKQKTADSYYS